MKKYKFTINGNIYNVSIKGMEDNQIDVEINGTPYAVELQQEIKQPKTPKLVRARVPQPTQEQQRIPQQQVAGFAVKAPLPGTIVAFAVKPGDSVERGSLLFTMEAMKMENQISAEQAGTIKTIQVQAGQSVLQDQVVMIME
ncbi:MAG: biotin/lipoyl-binding protein [Bacteroidetes bacterium]|nr:MAG: biotin/lipoyl-binding protein [Bacteroidota bacterium]